MASTARSPVPTAAAAAAEIHTETKLHTHPLYTSTKKHVLREALWPVAAACRVDQTTSEHKLAPSDTFMFYHGKPGAYVEHKGLFSVMPEALKMAREKGLFSTEFPHFDGEDLRKIRALSRDTSGGYMYGRINLVGATGYAFKCTTNDPGREGDKKSFVKDLRALTFKGASMTVILGRLENDGSMSEDARARAEEKAHTEWRTHLDSSNLPKVQIKTYKDLETAPGFERIASTFGPLFESDPTLTRCTENDVAEYLASKKTAPSSPPRKQKSPPRESTAAVSKMLDASDFVLDAATAPPGLNLMLQIMYAKFIASLEATPHEDDREELAKISGLFTGYATRAFFSSSSALPIAKLAADQPTTTRRFSNSAASSAR